MKVLYYFKLISTRFDLLIIYRTIHFDFVNISLNINYSIRIHDRLLNARIMPK